LVIGVCALANDRPLTGCRLPRPEHVYGVMPVCGACAKRISTAPTHCFCGRGLYGSFTTFLAQNEAGQDAEYAACSYHEKFVPRGPCCISDLRIITLKRP